MNMFIKTAAAIFAFAAMSEAAFAEEARAVDSRAVLDDIYVAMEKSRTDAFALVIASAEARMAERMAELDARADKPAASFLVATN